MPAQKVKRPSLEKIPDQQWIDRLRNPDQTIRDLYGDAALHPLSFCYVADKFSHFACFDKIALGGLVEFWLSKHEEREEKSREGIIFAALSQQRKDIFASSTSAAVYDIDDLLTFREVVERRECTGYVGPSWTTHSHGRAISTIDEGVCNGARMPRDLDPCTDAQGAAQLPKLRNVRVLDGGLAVNGEFRFSHDPVQRARSVIFFAEPVLLSEVGQDGWRAIYSTLGEDIFGPVFDVSCKNPARIHWAPAHRPGAPYEIVHHKGVLYDWRPLWDRLRPAVYASREKARERANVTMGETPAELAEIAHCLKSIPPDISRPEWFKCIAAIHHETKGSEQGRELAHEWSAGSPSQYDPDDLDSNIWEYLDPDHEGGPTMGSLVYWAKEHDPQFKKLQKKSKKAPLDRSYLERYYAANTGVAS
jgi:primase-like protein